MKQALALLDQAATRAGDSAQKNRIATIAAEALVHESADIQEATLDLIERHGDVHSRTIRELLATRVEGLNPSLRGRLEAWLAQPTMKSGSKQTRPEPPRRESAEKPLTELKRRASALDPRLAKLAGVSSALECLHDGRLDLPALDFDGTEFPRLDPERRLEQIDDLDALIDLCSRLIENPEPAEDLDRCVDAISRLCDQRPSDFEKRTAPLTARVRNRFDGIRQFPRHSLVSFQRIALGWLTGEIDRSGVMKLEQRLARVHRALGSREYPADRRGPCCTTAGDTHARRRLDRPACLRRTIPHVVQAPVRHAHRGSHHGAASPGS